MTNKILNTLDALQLSVVLGQSQNMSEDESCASAATFNKDSVVEDNGSGGGIVVVVVGAAAAIVGAKPANATPAKAIIAWRGMVIF